MAGVLNFTMGLQNGGFLGPLGVAQSGLNKMLGTTAALAAGFGTLTGLGAGFAGVMHQISEGDRLGELSARTATSVKDLAMLEHAFNDVGVGAGAVSPLLLQLQKSLGGVNEMGEPTNETFAKLGLSIEDLKKLDAPAQLKAIGASLVGLGKEDATAAASKIVSRGSAGDLLQIARQAEDFAAALAAAAPRAEILARNAAAFGRIDSSMKNLRESGQGFFAGIAEGAAPAIQLFVDKLNNMDLTGLGLRIGDTVLGVTEAFQQSRFAEVFELAMKAGIQGGSNFFLGEIAKWSEAVRKAFNPPDNQGPGLLKKFGAGAAGVGVGLLNVGSELGNMIDPRLIDQELLDKRYEFVNKMFDIAGLDQHGILDGIQIGAITNQFADDLKDLMAELIEDGKARALAGLSVAPKPTPGPPGEAADKSLAELFPTGSAFASGNLFTKFNRNSLESAGGYFNRGGSNPATDYARRTADGVSRTNQLIQTLTKVIIDRNQSIEKLTPWSHED